MRMQPSFDLCPISAERAAVFKRTCATFTYTTKHVPLFCALESCKLTFCPGLVLERALPLRKFAVLVPPGAPKEAIALLIIGDSM